MLKKIINYIMIFILIVITTIDILLLTLNATLLNKNYIYKMFNKEDIYTKTYELIIDKFKDNTIQSGLDDTILDNVISKELIEDNVKQIVDGLYDNKEIVIDKEQVKNTLKENIDNVIKENNKTVLKEEQEAIDVYIDTITNIYEDMTMQKYVKEIQVYTSKISKVLTTVAPILLTFNIILLIVIYKKENKENRENRENSISIVLLSTGMLLFIPKILEISIVHIKDIVVLNNVVSSIIIKLITNTTNILLIIGLILVIFGIFYSVLKYKNNMKN